MPISPPPVRSWRPEYLPAYISNGLIGLRAGPVPLIEGVAIVNGLAAIDPVEQDEGFARAPYPIAGDLEIDGHRLSRLPTRARLIEQRYDFSCGELSSRFAFAVDGPEATVDVLSFCSRTMPSVVVQEIRVGVDRPCRLKLSAGVDPAGIGGRWLSRETVTPGSQTPVVDGAMLWEPYGGLSSCGAAYVTEFDGGEGVERQREEQDRLAPLRTSYSVQARPGRCYVLRQLSSLVPSQMQIDPHRQATRLAATAGRRGFDRLRQENRGVWEEIWKGRVVLRGAGDRWQSIADAAFYYLHASSHQSSVFSTSMFGLAYWPNYHYYRGHVMWDIEAFVFPPLLLTAPESAQALLSFRLERMDAARRNAALMGYRGVQFPWASGPRHGQEVIRVSAPHLVLEQHVSLSVALAFAQYAHATGDGDYLREKTWPVLEGVARWIESRVVPSRRGYEWRETIGIAEQPDPVDNAAYVNLAAIRVLREAADCARRLDRGDAERWEALAGGLAVPMDAEREVIVNHDSFDPGDHSPAACTPEPLAAFFPVGYRPEARVEEATMRFHLDRVDSYLGRPMLSPLMGVFAARLADRARSLDLFERGYADFVQDPFGEANEFSRKRFPDKPPCGPFMANVGGFLTSCLYGLPGLRISPAEPAAWCERPVTLPEGWDAIEVERVHVRGRTASLSARQGEPRARLELSDQG